MTRPIAIALSFLFAPSAIAQIVPDSTTPTTLTTGITLTGETGDLIQGQPLTDNATNLFHSFERFDIPTDRDVQFELPNDNITTIITRVTGDTASQLDGDLIINGTADLFFLNPNGIHFGEQSRVQIDGDLILTTADSIQFGDDLTFSATNRATDPALLSVLVPTGLQFGEAPGAIVNQSQALGTPPLERTTFGAPLGIAVPADRALLVMGGDITVDAGSFSAIDGALELVSLSGTGEVSLGRDSGRYTFGAVTEDNRGTISLRNGAIVDTSGHPDRTFGSDDPGGAGGGLRIATSLLSLSGFSGIDVATYSGIGIDNAIYAETIEIRESSGIYINSENIGTSGSLEVETHYLNLESGGTVNAALGRSGRGGNLNITAKEIQIIGISAIQPSSISSRTIDSGTFDARAGEISIQAEMIDILDGGAISNTNSGNGQGGSIVVDAHFITVRGSAPDLSSEVSRINVDSRVTIQGVER